MSGARLDAVGLIVSDLERSVRFYRAIGLPFPDGAEGSEHGHAEVDVGGGFRLMLDAEASIASFDATWKPAEGGDPRAALALRCPTVGDVDRLYSVALANGGRGHMAPWDAFWGQRYARLQDPDGNGVDFYADIPAEV